MQVSSLETFYGSLAAQPKGLCPSSVPVTAPSGKDCLAAPLGRSIGPGGGVLVALGLGFSIPLKIRPESCFQAILTVTRLNDKSGHKPFVLAYLSVKMSLRSAEKNCCGWRGVLRGRRDAFDQLHRRCIAMPLMVVRSSCGEKAEDFFDNLKRGRCKTQ